MITRLVWSLLAIGWILLGLSFFSLWPPFFQVFAGVLFVAVLVIVMKGRVGETF